MISDIKVLYVVEQIEYERGWGARPEGFQCFLTEADADAYIAADEAAEAQRNPTGAVPDCYWKNHKIGYRQAHPTRLIHVQTSTRAQKRIYVDRVNDLLTPGS